MPNFSLIAAVEVVEKSIARFEILRTINQTHKKAS
jgi:hypothetical protein